MLSIVIPAYNEEKRIISTIQKIQSYLSSTQIPSEIIVVDDGSREPLKGILVHSNGNASLCILRNETNKGKGYAVWRGLSAAKGDVVCFTDADLSTSIEELTRVLPLMKSYDIVIGSRGMRDSTIITKQPWYRRLPGTLFPKLVRVILLPDFYDTQCGFKTFSRKALNIILPRQTIFGWGFDVEMLVIAKIHGLKVYELPITWKNYADSKLRVLSTIYSMFREVLHIRKNAQNGEYHK